MPRRPQPTFDLETFSVPFRAESDRACAVLGAALLDARLESLFNRRLIAHQGDLLANSGPLGAFSARMRVARALNWIQEDVYFDLNQIRVIRNEFAHNFDHELTFEDQAIGDKCRTLRVAQTLIDGSEAAALEPNPHFSASVIRAMGSVFKPPRERFAVTVEMLAQHLDDLPGGVAPYAGPDLRSELWTLAASVRVRHSNQTQRL